MVTAPETRVYAAALLAQDLLAFVEDIAAFSGNTDLQIRARVLIARVDLVAKQETQKAIALEKGR